MSGDVHVRFCEGLGVRFPRATLRNVYVRSRRGGERVLVSLTQFLEKRLKMAFRQGRGRNRQRFIEELQPLLRGWVQYFKLAEVKGTFEELDGWIRRHLRCLIWRQWKRTRTRAKNLIARGLTEERAWKSATNGRGPWWNARASHMYAAFPKAYFDRLGLVSLLTEQRRFQCFSRTAVVRNRMPGGVGGRQG